MPARNWHAAQFIHPTQRGLGVKGSAKCSQAYQQGLIVDDRAITASVAFGMRLDVGTVLGHFVAPLHPQDVAACGSGQGKYTYTQAVITGWTEVASSLRSPGESACPVRPGQTQSPPLESHLIFWRKYRLLDSTASECEAKQSRFSEFSPKVRSYFQFSGAAVSWEALRCRKSKSDRAQAAWTTRVVQSG